MAKARYRRGNTYAADMAEYLRIISEMDTNSDSISQMKGRLLAALKEDITEKQRSYLLLYYGSRMNMKEIGSRMGVDKSTVSRTIKRAEANLRRCLRYGAADLLACERRNEYADNH